MALQYITVKPGSSQKTVKMAQRLWLTADRKHVVVDGDPAAAFLLCSPGQEIPIVEATLLGLVREAAPAAVKAVAPQVKESSPAETKELKPDQTKAAELKTCAKCGARYRQTHTCTKG